MTLLTRRQALRTGAMLAGAGLLAGTGAVRAAGVERALGTPFSLRGGPDRRVIVCNDFSGDPDGVFALVHQLLAPASSVVAVIGTLLPMDLLGRSTATSADAATTVARELLVAMGLQDRIKLLTGSNLRLENASTARPSAGALAIVAEAMREDPRPLFVTVGAALTDIASAYLIEPRIAQRLTLVWIGGAPYPRGGEEYNLAGDVIAAQVLFNESRMPIWQVPSSTYTLCQYSFNEFQAEIAPRGAAGAWLWQRFAEKLARLPASFARKADWAMGDSPTVLATSLSSDSSPHAIRRAPRINADQSYTERGDGRDIRVYTGIDTRLMFGDFHALLKLHYPPGK
ncbi:MAG: twin-arginine translocation pathway signal protein [Massilia sp.]|nr:twin-arginine translocation pathway signal protein [Massilia sp.]MDB5950229.1 twin-arginine translocation pathway signal protein [Massilia sp.]